MTWLSILVFLPSILAGILIVHLLWPERGWKAGLGQSFPRHRVWDSARPRSWILFTCFCSRTKADFSLSSLALFVVLLLAFILRERKNLRFSLP